MSFQNLVQAAQKYFPDLQVKYKDQSALMKFIGTLLFFNKEFMTQYATTIGSTIYFPTETFTKAHPISSATIFLHELIHINDSKKITKPFFSFLYIFPQVLSILLIPLLFINWKIALPFIIFLAPFPAYFRMYYEKRAYLASLYCLNMLSKKLSFAINLDIQKSDFVSRFKGSTYYFMWPFSNIDTIFNTAVNDILQGKRPYEDPIFDILDDLINNV